MSTPIPVFLNANAGVFSSSLSAEQMQIAAREAGVEVEPIVTDSTDEMTARLKQLVESKCERIAIAGGDGTVALATQVLARSSTALAIIPQGTFNNFATALRLPQDLPSALRVLREGEVRDVDLGCVEVSEHHPRFFTEAAGVGLFADGLALYGKGSNKNFLRGLKAITRVLLSFSARRLELSFDGEKYSERAVMCICANTFRMAQGVPVAPGAKLTDGALDVVLVGDLSPGEVLSYYHAFRAQTHLDLPKITHRRARKITISGRRHMNVHCDDAFVGTTPATISSQPGALKVLLEVL
jgi:diacylglycerol kinase (ATP)